MKAKPKPDAEKHRSYTKPVLRSEAFARATSEAKLRVVGSGGLRSLFEKAAKECASLPREPFKENWPYLQTMLRLVRARERGEYTQVAKDDLIWIVTALNYLVDPYDLIPDRTPFLGFVDDAIVVDFVVDKTRDVLDDFMTWETITAGGSSEESHL
ncbi:MAG: YkvA family protein [Spartobacteria bacterium]